MRSLAVATVALVMLLEGGCSILTGGGPSTGAVANSRDVDIVKVTPQEAVAQAAVVSDAEKADIDHELSQLGSKVEAPVFAFGPGASLTVTLWSYSPRPDGPAAPGPTPLGAYVVSADGAIALPYVGGVNLTGLTLEQAQDTIKQRYAALGLFQSPSIAIEVGAAPQGHVTVTGSVGQPRIIPWNPAGITLADALTQSLGDGTSLLGQANDLSSNISAIRVAVVRGAQPPVELPISIALERSIPLRPGDQVVVKKAPAVEVTVLGPGIQNNGVFGFAESPPLTQVLAKAAGVNPNAANNHAVFILRKRQGDRPVLYDFAWNRAQGLIAASRFPVKNGDLVYVAEAPIVSAQRVIAIIFQLALPAQIL